MRIVSHDILRLLLWQPESVTSSALRLKAAGGVPYSSVIEITKSICGLISEQVVSHSHKTCKFIG